MQMFIFLLVTVAANPVVQVVPGIYLKEIKEVLIYETEFEWNLEIELPHNYELLKPPSGCTAADYLCQLEKTMYEGYVHLQRELDAGHSFLRKNKTAQYTAKRGIFNFLGDGFSYLYGLETEADALAIKKDNANIHKNEDILRKSVATHDEALVQIVKNLTNYSAKMQSFLSTERSLFNASISKLYNSNFKNEAVLGFSVNTLMHITYLLNSISHTNTAGLECRGKFVPYSLIGEPKWANELSNLRKVLLSRGLEIAASASSLLSRAICSCIITPNYLYASIRVPVKRSSVTFNTYEVIPIPFLHDNEQCVVAGTTNHIIVSPEGVIPITNAVHHKCDIANTRMCRIPSYGTTFSGFSGCASILVREHTAEEIIKNCVLECRRSDAKIKTWIGYNEFALTNYASISVLCQDGGNTSVTPHNSFGALVINRPCGCDVQADEELLRSPVPCFLEREMKPLIIKTIIPVGWTSMRSVVLSDSLQYRNMTDVLNENWKIEVPFIALSPPKPQSYKEFSSALPVFGSVDIREDMLILWLLLLSLIVGYMAFNGLLTRCRQAKFSMNPAKYIPFLPVPSASAVDPEGTGFLRSVWTFVMNMEWVLLAGYVIMFLLGCLLLVICCRILRYVKKTASCLTSAMSMPEFDEEMMQPQRRRRSRTRK